jgi:hypothetical protein
MANEITYAVSIAASKGGASISSGTLSDTIDMAGTDMGTVTQAIGTSNEALDTPDDVTGAGHVVIKNLDATNYVEIFSDNGNANLMSKLGPGEACSFRSVTTTSLYGRANTAACQIQLWMCEA